MITPASGGDLGQRRVRHPELGPDLRHQLAQVQRDDPVAGRDPVAGLVLEHVDELLLRRRAGLDEDLLHARRLQQPLHTVRNGLPRGGRDRWRQLLEVGGQPLLERGSDIHVVVELVDQEDRERILDLRVLDQPGARVRPGLVVEHLPLHPRRKDRSQRDQRGEHDQRPHERTTTPAHPARRPIGVDGSGIGRRWGLCHACILFRIAPADIARKR